MKRYPGIQSYNQDRRHLFFGRERETKELFRLAVLQPIVVLFGKSGTGKTSLIQAGVTPMLHERRLHPVFLRINQTDKPIVQQIHALLEQGEFLPYDTPDNLTLWDYCHQFAYSEAGDSFTPLYVLDQFEELFTLYADQPEEQKRFIEQLAQVMNGTPPKGHPTGEPPKAHFLISIRSDYLYLLDRLSDQIPAILRTRYELSDLTIDNARQAIEQPALAEGTFDSPKFAYTPAAIDNIIAELSQEQQSNTQTQTREVGGFQLQLLCQRIEQEVINAPPPAAPPLHIPTVAPYFYGGSEGIRKIIGDFYDSVLAQYPNADTRRRVRQLVEEGLISNGRRIILEENYLKERYHLTQADIELLNRERLCRKEARANQWYYEISHDTLLKPINTAYEERRAKEERQRLEAEKAEADRKAAEAAAQAERDRQLREAAEKARKEAETQKEHAVAATRRANIFTVIAVIVALAAVGAGVFAWQQKAEADKQTKIAAQKKQEAEAATEKANEQRDIAKKALKEVEAEKNKAENQRKEANKQKTEAERQKEAADKQRQQTETEKKKTEAALSTAQEKERQRKAAEDAAKAEKRKNVKGETERIKTLILSGDIKDARLRLQKALELSPDNNELLQLQKQLNP